MEILFDVDGEWVTLCSEELLMLTDLDITTVREPLGESVRDTEKLDDKDMDRLRSAVALRPEGDMLLEALELPCCCDADVLAVVEREPVMLNDSVTVPDKDREDTSVSDGVTDPDASDCVLSSLRERVGVGVADLDNVRLPCEWDDEILDSSDRENDIVGELTDFDVEEPFRVRVGVVDNVGDSDSVIVPLRSSDCDSDGVFEIVIVAPVNDSASDAEIERVPSVENEL